MRKKILIILNLLSALIIFKGLLLNSFSSPSLAFKFTAFDVGQGDSLLMAIPGTTIQLLIDTGPASGPILEKLKKQLPPGDDLIDILMITHCHADHTGGLSAILDNYKIGLFVESGSQCEEAEYREIKERIQILEIPSLVAIRGERIKIGEEFSLEIMHPFLSQGLTYKNENNASLVSLVSWKKEKLILMGDLEEEGEKELLSYLKKREKLTQIRAKILKVGHHGSKTATSLELLTEIKPEQAIISCGVSNKFGHPHSETISKLQDGNIKILRTDEVGDIEIEF